MGLHVGPGLQGTSRFFHVMPPSSNPLAGGSIPNPLRPIGPQEDWATRFRWPLPAHATTRVEHRIGEGDADSEIIRLANPVSADLIVIGTHGRTGFNRLMLGSVAEQVLRKSNCPLFTVK